MLKNSWSSKGAVAARKVLLKSNFDNSTCEHHGPRSESKVSS